MSTTITGNVASQKKKPQQAKPQVQQKLQENVSFFDEKWSGHQIAKLTGDNAFTDWLQNKDKVCTDGKDDGKLSFTEGAISFAKGLIGGIPKAMINHPVASAIAIGAGTIATAVAGTAILVPMTAIGLVTGVGMVGYGAYKAATAKTDGEAKQALETCGMGVTTTATTAMNAGKVLDTAAKEGVQSAQVSEDAGTFTKVKTLFKATPEALKVSGHNTKNTYTMFRYNTKTTLDGTKQMYDKDGQLSEEVLSNGTVKTYKNGQLREELLTDGRVRKYIDRSRFDEIFPDGRRLVYNSRTGKLSAEYYPDGTHIDYYNYYDRKLGDFTVTTLKDGSYTVVDNSTGNVIKTGVADGGFKTYDGLGRLQDAEIIEGNRTSFYENGNLVEVKETLTNGGFKIYDAQGNLKSAQIVDGNKTSIYKNGEWSEVEVRTTPAGYHKVVEEQESHLGNYIKYLDECMEANRKRWAKEDALLEYNSIENKIKRFFSSSGPSYPHISVHNSHHLHN